MPETETSAPVISPEAAPSGETFGAEPQETSAPASESNGDQANGSKPLSAAQREQQPKLSRYERIKRKRAELQKREAALREREERIAQAERAKNAPKKPEYTVAELKEFRQGWENDGRFDLVEAADKEIARLEKLEQQEKGQQSFEQEWRQAEAELAQADPEFGFNKGTKLDKKLGEIMQGPDGNIYRQHPRGIVAAYHRAKMEILESDHQAALGKIQQLETELKRLTGLSSIGGGAPGRVGTARVETLADFAKLSTKDMRQHLRSSRGSNAMPWL